MLNRKALVAVIIVVVVAVGAFAYFKLRPRATAQAQQDPALQIVLALTALERSESNQLTDDQIRTVLPLLRVLRDTNPDNTDVTRALVMSIRKVLTPEQLAALEQMRQDAQSRRDQDQDGGSGPQRPRRGPPGTGQGFAPGGPGSPGIGPGAANPQTRGAFRAQARQALLARLIRRLENRL